MKLTHLRDVIAAAELGSLRAAARHLGIAQPSITRSIREVEHELGVPLFERHQQGGRFTSTGDAFVKRAIAVQSELRRAREEIGQLNGGMTGKSSGNGPARRLSPDHRIEVGANPDLLDMNVLAIISDLLVSGRLRYGEESDLGRVPVFGPLSTLVEASLALCGAPKVSDIFS